jgi:hypothetical protein
MLPLVDGIRAAHADGGGVAFFAQVGGFLLGGRRAQTSPRTIDRHAPTLTQPA